MKALYISEELIIRQMSEQDVLPVCRAAGNDTPEEIRYLNRQMTDQRNGECISLLAVYHGMIAGYVFLYHQCKWGGLGGQGIPGIVDLIVFEPYRRHGIAGKLMEEAEKLAAEQSDRVYLDVCLSSAYGMAQRLYFRRGYIPDGKGVYYQEKVCPKNAPCKNDNELTLCLVKKLK